MNGNAAWTALLREAKRRKKLYPTTAALRLAGLWFPGPDAVAALRRALDEVVTFLPTGLLARFVAHATGHVVVVPRVPPGLRPRTSCYLEGEVPIEGKALDNVVCILGADLVRREGVGQHELTHLLDHLLGSDGRPEGMYLSEGGGIDHALRELGERVQALYRGRPQGGYRDWIGPRGYLARAVQVYCVRPEELSRDDPAMFRFLEEKLLNEVFWDISQRAQRSAEDAENLLSAQLKGGAC